uniref:Uncharacterized protein n=1 Tax=Rhizophora mucronata TaxID=61149 RepID=A0A2P2JQU4_RHIMU
MFSLIMCSNFMGCLKQLYVIEILF